MPRNCDNTVNDSKVMVESELHTRHATPGRLSMELENLLGGSGFQIEMRHNVYNIKSTKPIDMESLLNKCKGLHPSQATGVGFESISAVLNVQGDVNIECIKYPDSSYTRNADTAFGKFAPALPHEP